jgi:PhzF family phenazine biosynthesis protein
MGLSIPKDLIFTLLNTSDLAPDLPYQIASVGSPKLLIPLSSEKTLAQLSPNLAAIKAWSIETGVNGVYVYTQISENEFAARNFNPKTGLTEDIATGVSAGALAAALCRSIHVFQGQYLGHPSQIKINYEDSNNLWVGGVVKEMACST